jgi:shikimate dehydrogenase
VNVTGATRVAGVIGDPVRHSLSPVLHNVAYRELGLDWIYVAFAVPDGAAKSAVDAVRALGLVGLSVTMPHKAPVAAVCDTLSDEAASLVSVNTVTLEADGRIAGDSTDGRGFLRSLHDAGCDPRGMPTVVLGAGGAARAVAYALGRMGARVAVAARRPEAAMFAADLAGGDVVPWDERTAAVAGAALVVNATPIGMAIGMASGELPVPLDALRAGQVVADLVYHPTETAFLAGAHARGALAVDGLGMLVHQAGLQVERWTGHAAPIAAMRDAVRHTLAQD